MNIVSWISLILKKNDGGEKKMKNIVLKLIAAFTNKVSVSYSGTTTSKTWWFHKASK